MAVEKLDITNLHRTSAIMKIAAKFASLKKGDMLEVIGSSLTFTDDMEEWCKRYNKKYSFYLDPENNSIKCQIHI
jgi:TusA-related sulfurtransferase